MRARFAAVAAAAALVAGSAVGIPGTPAAHAAVNGCPAGLPSGIPPASCAADPALPVPAPSAWPFPDAFSHTSGTGRLAGGAFFWTDFVFDDYGALGNGTGQSDNSNPSDLAPTHGSYVHPGFDSANSSPAAQGKWHNDGADIFTAAVGLTGADSYWRVDWNTLTDPTVPIAEWTFDTDNNTATGGSAWPAGAGVSSPGIDKALVVSSHGAALYSVSAGGSSIVGKFPVTVDMATHSFIVAIPRGALPVSGTWRIRLAAGLASGDGTTFAPVPSADGALPGEPNVYNVTFRSYLQEPPVYNPAPLSLPAGFPADLPNFPSGNFWMEADQALTLAAGDVSKFSALLDWSQLADRVETPEPEPTGYTNRWYVSAVDVGEGTTPNNSADASGDLQPHYLGRIQPYAVYVPSTYRPGVAMPLTWVEHSLGVNLNQYGAVASDELFLQCEQRRSICATTEGYGPSGWYFDAAELDFFRVWHALAASYTLDPERTTMSGYSMGGFATFKLGLTYPDLFAESLALEGPPGCGLRVIEGQGSAAGAGRCTADGDTTPLVANARWVPYIITSGTVDELVPVTSLIQQGLAFEAAGDRTVLAELPTEDHLAYSVENAWAGPVGELSDPTLTNSPAGIPARTTNPGTITYTWFPDGERPDLGVAPTGIYWIRGLTPRTAKPGQLAAVDAVDAAHPDPAIVQHVTTTATVWPPDQPVVLRDLTWTFGARPAARRLITVRLTDIAATGIDMARAQLPAGYVDVTSDGPTTLSLDNLAPGTPVTAGNPVATIAGANGTAVVALPAGTTDVCVGAGCPIVSTGRPSFNTNPPLRGSLPATGGDPLLPAAGLVLLGLGLLAGRAAQRRFGVGSSRSASRSTR
ncbi:MAG TPA: peptidase [Mycobacteriales bacterium]|nr:peptidase [Mycobacteriales bacterium]